MRTLAFASVCLIAFGLYRMAAGAQEPPHKEKALGHEIASLIRADRETGERLRRMGGMVVAINADYEKLERRVEALEKALASKACQCDHAAKGNPQYGWRPASDGSWLYGYQDGGVFRYSEVYRAAPACAGGACGR